MDMQAVESALRRAGYTPISCPTTEVPVVPKHTFACVAGAGLPIIVTITDDKGNYTWTPVGAASSAAPPSEPQATLLWSHIGTFTGDPYVTYVARATNSGDSPVPVTFNVYATDASGTIVGSDQPTTPTITPHGHFDYLGTLGAAFSPLSGTPAHVKVGQASSPKAGVELLRTSQLTLTTGSTEDSLTGDPYAYNVSVKVTNNTGQEITGGATQQAILYDAAGHIVGGDTGSSDNVPNSLPAGASYREQWTGIPAVQRATSATYSVWPG
jgi:hypothetical protein